MYHHEMGLLSGPRPKRDGASFEIIRFNKKTGAILSSETVIGTRKAQEVLALRRLDECHDSECAWELRPRSGIAAYRRMAGFQRN